MLVYFAPIAMAVFSILVHLTNQRRADLALLFVIAAYVVVISGFRYFSDIDYVPYLDLYAETPDLSSVGPGDFRLLYGEPGYLFLTSLLKSVDADFYVVTLIASITSISAKSFVAFKFVRNSSFVISIYLCLSFVTIEFIQIRWAIATGLLCLAYYSLYQQRRGSALLFFVVASLFHYFSIAFFILSYFTRIGGFLRYFAVLSAALLFSLVIRSVGFTFSYETDTDIYLVARFFRYLNDPLSNVGIFSYLKIFFYAVSVYFLLRIKGCNIDIDSDRKFNFLLRLSFIFLIAALGVSAIPIFFFRTMVMADLFSIMLIAYIVSRIEVIQLRMSYVYLMTALFSVWCYFDVQNYSNAQRIFEYRSWLGFVL